MPRRNQEAEDEAYAKALQDEYRKDFTRRQAQRSGRDNDSNHHHETSTTLGSMGDPDRDREQTTSASNNDRKTKKKKKGKKKSKENKSKSSGSGNANTIHRRSSSQGSDGSATDHEKRRRRRRRKDSEKAAASLSGEEWLSTYHSDQQQQQQQHQQHIVAPPIPSSLAVVPLPPPFLQRNNDRGQSEWSGGNRTNVDDEVYARMVQAELLREDEAERSGQRSPPFLVFPIVPPTHESNPRRFSFKDSHSSGSTEPCTDDDEVVARRIQQELTDAEYAQRISNLERDEAASREIVQSLERQQQQQQQQEAPKKSCFAKWAPMVVCVAIAVTIPLLYVFDVFNPSDIPFLGDIFQDDWQGGPSGNITFDNINGTIVPRLPDDAFGWANKGKGLELDILNACGDEWQPFVQEAIENWDKGSPIDSLTLFTTRVPYEDACQTVEGKMKICNSNYGETRWRGLNEVLLSPRQATIFASTAKLNEYYLNFESDAQKLYTCCHELGHGFGLPHWDENFSNKDLGNCMDYTLNPKKNSKPDASTFLYLAQLYGGRDIKSNKDVSPSDASIMAFANSDGDDFGVRRLVKSLETTNPAGSIPLSESRLRLGDDAYDTLPGGSAAALTRRILHADEEGEIHIYESMEFPGNLVVQHYLLVQDYE